MIRIVFSLIVFLILGGGSILYATQPAARTLVHAFRYERTLDAYEQNDTTQTVIDTNIANDQRETTLISAFFGLDDALPRLSGRVICQGAAGKDGMPLIFSHEVDVSTIEPGDFKVTTASGAIGYVECLTMAPADDPGELRTVLLVGSYGSVQDQPDTVEISGNILTLDGSANFKGAKIDVTRLEDGPTLVWAEIVPREEWDLGRKPTQLRFGGGSGCPEGTRQVVRVTWDSGITKPNNAPVDDLERLEYVVTIAKSDRTLEKVAPFALGDLNDGDNNHELCLDTEDPARAVSFPPGFVTDPRGDLNPASSIQVQ